MGEVEIEVEGGRWGMRWEKGEIGSFWWVGGLGLACAESNPRREIWVRNLGCQGRSKGGANKGDDPPPPSPPFSLSVSLSQCRTILNLILNGKGLFGLRFL